MELLIMEIFYNVENDGKQNEGGYGHAVVNVWIFTEMDYVCDKSVNEKGKIIKFSNRELFFLQYQNNEQKNDENEVIGISPWYAEYLNLQEHPNFKIVNEIWQVFKAMEKYEDKVRKMNLAIPARDDQMYYRINLLEGAGAKRVNQNKENGVYYV
jgi:hypothetical protein